MIDFTIAFYVYDKQLPAWLVLCVEKLAAQPGVKFAGIIQQQKRQSKPHQFSELIYRLYRKLENKISKPTPNAFATKQWPPSFQQIPVIADTDIEIIRQWQPHCIINLSSKIIPESIKVIPALGTWYYGPGNLFNAQAASAVALAVIKQECSTPICLMVEYANTKKTEILYESYSSTQPYINRNLNMACWKAASFASRVIAAYQLSGTLQKIENEALTATRYFRPPGNGLMLKFLLKKSLAEGKRYIQKRKQFQQWLLLHHTSPDKKVSTDFSKYTSITAPKKAFWADPSVFIHNNTRYIFFEEYLYATKKAHISVLTIEDDGQPSAPLIVLDKPYHLSYPFIFEHDGQIYMLPESSANKTIELYRATAFPYKWELEKVLMQNLHAVDSTLYFHENKWWLFTNIKENNGASAWDELYIFHAPHFLTDQWTAHTQNPLVSDVRTARPAGNLYTEDNKLIRPSQDCSCTYGYAINLNEIELLTPTAYQEKLISKTLPIWDENIKAIHTLSSQDGFVAIDARKMVKK